MSYRPVRWTCARSCGGASPRAAPGLRRRPSRGGTWCGSAPRTARYPMRILGRWWRLSLAPHAEHALNQLLDRVHRLKVLGSDVGLGDRDVEFELDREHEIHHFQRTDSQIAQLG